MQEHVSRRYIGTFHKTGTVLFKHILENAHKNAFIVPWFMHLAEEPVQWDVAFDDHSTKLFDRIYSDLSSSRYVFSIRDPRDLIVSAAYYHCSSSEQWLHVPNNKFGGLTYQEKINSLRTMSDRFMFEMEQSSHRAIDQMLRVPTGSASVLVTKLETLVSDYQLSEFERIFSFLNFDAGTILKLLPIAYENSIFSGKVAKSQHVRSGKPAQYISEFENRVLARYYEIYGNAAERLGYPK